MKAHEKGNGNAPKPTSSKAGAAVADAKESASVKSEQVRLSCSLCIVWCMGLVAFACEGCMKLGNTYVYFVVTCFSESLRVSYR